MKPLVIFPRSSYIKEKSTQQDLTEAFDSVFGATGPLPAPFDSKKQKGVGIYSFLCLINYAMLLTNTNQVTLLYN